MNKSTEILSLLILLIALLCNIGVDISVAITHLPSLIGGNFASNLYAPFTSKSQYNYWYFLTQSASWTLMFIGAWLGVATKRLKISITYFIIISIAPLINDINDDAITWHIGDIVAFIVAIPYTLTLLINHKKEKNEQRKLLLPDK